MVAGDNATITRSLTADGSGWAQDPLTGGVARDVVLLDLASSGDTMAAISGPDVADGGAGTDRIFGQDGDDRLSGGTGDDMVEGNGGADLLRGDLPVRSSADPGPHGQDDLVGGSGVVGHRDAGDTIEGDGGADFMLGDNETLTRSMEGDQVSTYGLWSPETKRREPRRFDVGGAPTASGGDTLLGGGGDDFQWGQDGDDLLRGGGDNDVMYGELGADELFGEAGEDALVGDRGFVASSLRAPGTVFTNTGEPAMSHRPFAAHPLDRRVDLLADGDGDPVEHPGLTSGGNDFLRGGPDHDVLHGGFGDDVMNGDSGGDYLFGADGSDVMWGGKGNPDGSADRGEHDRYVDHLYGGHGGSSDHPATGGADLLDFRPRLDDPEAWHRAVAAEVGDPSGPQHSQGIDWIFGGFDRDVLQSDVSDNGPNQGDRLIDWTGAYNLYTHCSAAYGGYNDVRQFSPDMQAMVEQQQLAHAHGLGVSLDDLRSSASSGWRVLGMVTQADTKSNSGKAYPDTSGSFTTLACEPDAG